MTSHFRAWAYALLIITCVACGDEVSKTESTQTSDCACPDNVCQVGECVLEVVISESCAASWGTAVVYLNDLASDAQPVGQVSAAAPFRTCEALEADGFDDAGNQTHSGAPFSFVVESEDGRLLSGSTGGEMFECASSSPFVWTIDGC